MSRLIRVSMLVLKRGFSHFRQHVRVGARIGRTLLIDVLPVLAAAATVYGVFKA